MTIEAAAEALATEQAQPAEVADQAPAEMSEDEALSAAFDAAEAGDEPAHDPEPSPEPEQAKAEADAPADDKAEGDAEAEGAPDDDDKADEVPTDMPKAVRDAWADIPAEARDALVESHRRMGRQLADQGRMVHGIKPIQDVLVQAVQELPALANMKPEQVAQEAMALAKISNDFETKPVETMMGLIKQHNLEGPLRQILTGQQPGQDALTANQQATRIAHLERRLEQVSDPEYLRGHVAQFNEHSQVQASVQEFSQAAEHWSDVEQHMPDAIQYVKASQPNASPADTLKRAYDLAVSQFVPEAKKATPPAPAVQAVPVADPAKTQAARKATSANIKSTPSGNARPLTEDQALSKAWDKMHAS